MKKILYTLLAVLVMASCEISPVVNPNGPDLDNIINSPSATDLNNLVVGMEDGIRRNYAIYVTATGTLARELYLFDADPRNTEDLLGKNGTALDNNSFYTTANFTGRYRVIKNANILLQALENAGDVLSDAEISGYRGFANTMIAYQLLLVLNQQNNNGVRIDVADPTNLGPFLSKDASLQAIEDFLTQGNTQLAAAGSEFRFSLTSGFAGFDDPASFITFNRALAARVALYSEDYNGALTALNSSFFELNGDLTAGPKQVFSTTGGDLLNGVYKVPGNNGDIIVVHNRMIADALAGDTRVAAKFGVRADPTTQDGLSASHETTLYPTSTSPIDIIRNEELVLIYAEVNAQLGNTTEALNGINVIRASAGLADYAGGTSQAELIDEILFQRRYSLWCEGHLMVDLRRYGRLNADNLPLDRAGDLVYFEFPRPLTEVE